MIVTLGFSTGCFHKSVPDIKKALAVIRNAGFSAVELGYVRWDDFRSGTLGTITAQDLAGFDYVSLHAPVIEYGRNADTQTVFEKIAALHKLRPLDLIVFHPNTIRNFGVFEEAGFPVAFENMDNRKTSHRTPSDFETLLQFGPPARFMLDVNHAYTNDHSMRLAHEFFKFWGDRIAQIHLSGYAGYHEPLFKTRQPEIIRAIEDWSIPIIVESVLSPEELTLERDYIFDVLKGLPK